MKLVEKIKSEFSLASGEVIAFALRFILSNSNVNVVIPAASNIDQLNKYINVFNTGLSFTKKELDSISNFIRENNSGNERGQI